MLVRRIHAAFSTGATTRALSSFLSDTAAAAAVIASAKIEHGKGGGGGGDGGDGKGSLVRRLIGLIYAKRSAVVVLTEWSQEGKRLQKYQLNRIVRELRKYDRYKHALEVSNSELIITYYS